MSLPLAPALAAHTETHPQACALIERLASLGPLVSGSLPFLLGERAEAFWPMAERLAGYSAALGGQPVESLAEYTVAYLKEQAAYQATGEYSHAEFQTAFDQVYDNPDVMERFYLEGLMLTHAFWPIHLDIHAVFRDAFLPLLPAQGCGLEVGFGHGLYLVDILQAHPGQRTRSFDISRFSLAYAQRLLSSVQISPERFELELADAREPLPVADASQSWAVFAEVLEHIPNPGEALADIVRCLAPGAHLFTTTVLYSNALDHLTQFADAEEVRALLSGAGLEILEERAFAVKDYTKGSKDPTIDLVYVCRRAP